MRHELRKILAESENSSTDRQAELAGELEEAKVKVMARIMRLAPASSSQQLDRLIDAKEAAKRLGRSTSYVYHHADEWDFTHREFGGLKFSERGVDAKIATKRR